MDFTLAEKRQIAQHFESLKRWAPDSQFRLEAVERTENGFRLPVADAERLTAQAATQMQHARSPAMFPGSIRSAFEFFGMDVPAPTGTTDLDAPGGRRRPPREPAARACWDAEDARNEAHAGQAATGEVR
jgi:hypothetical protein